VGYVVGYFTPLHGAISPAFGFGHKIDMPKSDRLTSHIRLSTGLKKRLKVAAAENGRSLNEEVVLRKGRSTSPANSAARSRRCWLKRWRRWTATIARD
jgi:hypothetical protein